MPNRNSDKGTDDNRKSRSRVSRIQTIRSQDSTELQPSRADNSLDSSIESPKSILKHRYLARNHVALKIGPRRPRRRRHISWKSQNEVFYIQTVRSLKEEYRKKMRRRRLRRLLTMKMRGRRSNSTPLYKGQVIRRRAKSQSSSSNQRPRTLRRKRKNRLSRAIIRYNNYRRRQSRRRSKVKARKNNNSEKTWRDDEVVEVAKKGVGSPSEDHDSKPRRRRQRRKSPRKPAQSE